MVHAPLSGHREIFFFYCVDICTDGAPTMVGVTAGVLAQTTTVSLNSTSSYCVLNCQHSLLKKKKNKTQLYLRIFLMRRLGGSVEQLTLGFCLGHDLGVVG